MKKALRRLRLRDGDVVLVSDAATMDCMRKFCEEPHPELPKCSVVYAPGGLRRVSRKYLEERFGALIAYAESRERGENDWLDKALARAKKE